MILQPRQADLIPRLRAATTAASNGSPRSRAARGPFHCNKRRRDARRRTPRRHHSAKVLATRPSSGARQSGSRPRARTISTLSANLLKTALDGLGRYFYSSQKKRGQRIYPLTSCFSGRVDWIRTSDPLTPSQVRYQTAPPPEDVRLAPAVEYINTRPRHRQGEICSISKLCGLSRLGA